MIKSRLHSCSVTEFDSASRLQYLWPKVVTCISVLSQPDMVATTHSYYYYCAMWTWKKGCRVVPRYQPLVRSSRRAARRLLTQLLSRRQMRCLARTKHYTREQGMATTGRAPSMLGENAQARLQAQRRTSSRGSKTCRSFSWVSGSKVGLHRRCCPRRRRLRRPRALRACIDHLRRWWYPQLRGTVLLDARASSTKVIET
ncbi:hypothetical protein K491DRAFT_71277 [Lophiostoma macrostomum CBS 122681]|uniref:Uncharacterized protein n=1 Tax=Lophiostoma macrostomum CBS 122681 TaxID=1314788 RepID=A0A6A6SWB8_9PLEO|nr:hypothetical protein K491DRAFT_71277 [Lophiostoma macrostomum CBS 122681]